MVTSYADAEVPRVIEACERMAHHLTAAVVSNDVPFRNRILANTVNGTTYAGRRARVRETRYEERTRAGMQCPGEKRGGGGRVARAPVPVSPLTWSTRSPGLWVVWADLLGLSE